MTARTGSGPDARHAPAPGAGKGGRRTALALGSLFVGTFVMGTAELVVVGILDLVARDLDVPLATAGSLVTAYALGICVGGPALTAVTIRLSRRTVLRMSLAGYAAGNLLALFATGFSMLFAARLITGALQGLFMGAAFAAAAALVPAERLGRAISVVFAGVAVSTALGVPAGTLIGRATGWRTAFAAITVLGALALVLTLLCVPALSTATGSGRLRTQARHALAPRVLAVLGVGFLLMGGQFAAFTYITLFLEQVTGVSGPVVSAFLLAFGAATAAGAFAGGRAADRAPATTVAAAAAVLVCALGALYLFGQSAPLAAVALAVWGLAGFGFVPSLQYLVIHLAGPGRDLAATLPASAVNAGIALGALAGGTAVGGAGADGALLTGLVVCSLALPAAWAVRFLKAPADA
ncbi:MFS transporter [Streptomyces sp. NPDC050529]|uniref:MFS transporter n=1 Tax=Streptomyces sp. NPDC050529 TaxID=3365624 RepID=UPI003790D627